MSASIHKNELLENWKKLNMENSASFNKMKLLK